MSDEDKPKPPAAAGANVKPPGEPKSRAPKPVTMLSGTGGFTPRASSVPQERPPGFPKDLWPQTKRILLNAQKEFPDQEDALKLCNYVTKEMTPLFVEAVKTGKMEATSIERQYAGQREDLLGLLLVCNAGRSDLGGLSDAAYRLREKVWKSEEWFAMAEAIAEAHLAREAESANISAPKSQHESEAPLKAVAAQDAQQQAPPPKTSPMRSAGLGQKETDLSHYFDAADLTERQRECASLSWEYGLGVTEIARRLGLSHHSTVQESLDAAKRRLERDGNFKRALKKAAAHGSSGE